MIDYVGLHFDVEGWSQTITNGKGFPVRQFSCRAKPQADEKLELHGGPDIRTLGVSLSLVRGEYQPNGKPIARGIGVLALASEQPPRPPDIDGMEAFLHGWWWLPEELYDEIWLQVRQQTWNACVVDMDIGPVDYESSATEIRWDLGKHRVLGIDRASVRFDRRPPPKPTPEETPRRRGLFG